MKYRRANTDTDTFGVEENNIDLRLQGHVTFIRMWRDDGRHPSMTSGACFASLDNAVHDVQL